MNRLQLFQLLCQCLAPAAPESAAAEALAQRLAGEPIDWGRVVSLANGHLVGPTLGFALAQSGLFRQLPSELQEYLSALRGLTRQRNLRLRQQLCAVGTALNALGIEPLLLKGSAGLLGGLYPDDTVRLLNDLDLAVPARRLDDSIAALTARGYRLRSASEGWQCHHHAPPLDHPDWPAPVELHRKLTCVPCAPLRDMSAVWKMAQTLTHEGVSWRLPSPEHRVLHHFVHTQLQDGNYRAGSVQLRQLYELLLLRRAYDERLDWPALLAIKDRARSGSALRAYLLIAEKLLGQPVPPEMPVSVAARRSYHRLLLHTYSPAVAWISRRVLRLPYLPLRLVTPSWYPAKYRALTQHRGRGAAVDSIQSNTLEGAAHE